MITQPISLHRCTQIVRSFLVPCICLLSGGRHKGTAFPFHSPKTTASKLFQRRGFILPLVNYWTWGWRDNGSSCWHYQWLTNHGFILWALPQLTVIFFIICLTALKEVRMNLPPFHLLSPLSLSSYLSLSVVPHPPFLHLILNPIFSPCLLCGDNEKEICYILKEKSQKLFLLI